MAFFRSCWTACLSALVVGILLGLLFARMFHRNFLNLTVLPSGQVYLAPKKGDILKWHLRTTEPAFRGRTGTDDLKINFGGKESSPCEEGDNLVQCTATSDKGLFFYSCLDRSGNNLCPDPGIDPNSSTDGMSYSDLVWPANPLSKAIPTAVALGRPAFSAASEGQPGGEEGQDTKVPDPPRTINMIIKCTGGKTEDNLPGKDPSVRPVVQTGWTIQWNGGRYGYDIDIPHLADVCELNAPIGSQGATSCKVKATTDVTYTITTTTHPDTTEAKCDVSQSDSLTFKVINPPSPGPYPQK